MIIELRCTRGRSDIQQHSISMKGPHIHASIGCDGLTFGERASQMPCVVWLRPDNASISAKLVLNCAAGQGTAHNQQPLQQPFVCKVACHSVSRVLLLVPHVDTQFDVCAFRLTRSMGGLEGLWAVPLHS